MKKTYIIISIPEKYYLKRGDRFLKELEHFLRLWFADTWRMEVTKRDVK